MDDDDLDDYKLATTINTDHVLHLSYERDQTSRGRKIAVEERWYPKDELGRGGFGVVRLEENPNGKQRAVKVIDIRNSHRIGVIDYKRELAALAVFSRKKVWCTTAYD